MLMTTEQIRSNWV